MSTRLDPITRWVRSLPGRYYKLEEAAEQLGVSHRTMRRWLAKDRALAPSKIGVVGKTHVYLYTRADIERIRQHLADTKRVVDFTPGPRPVGRPRKWSPEQKAERTKLYAKKQYWLSKAQRMDRAGNAEAARAARDVVSGVEQTLADMTPGANQ